MHGEKRFFLTVDKSRRRRKPTAVGSYEGRRWGARGVVSRGVSPKELLRDPLEGHSRSITGAMHGSLRSGGLRHFKSTHTLRLGENRRHANLCTPGPALQGNGAPDSQT